MNGQVLTEQEAELARQTMIDIAEVIEHADTELRNKVECLHQCIAERIRQHILEAAEVGLVVRGEVEIFYA